MNQKLIGGRKFNNYDFWVLDNGVLGVSFELTILDLELSEKDQIYSQFSEMLRNLKNTSVRWHLKANHEQYFVDGHKRAKAIYEHGSKKFSLYLHFEKNVSWLKEFFTLEKTSKDNAKQSSSKNILEFDRVCSEWIDDLPIDKFIRMGFQPRNLALFEIPTFLLDLNKTISIQGSTLDLGDGLISVIKLTEPKEELLSDVMDRLMQEVPCPFEIVIQEQIPEKSKVSMQFQFNVKRESAGGLFASGKRFFSNKEALEKQELDGAVYHNFEWHLVIKRKTRDQLRLDVSKAFDIVNRELGTCTLIGTQQFFAYASTLIGSQFHTHSKFNMGGLIEEHRVLPYFIPLFTRGTQTSVPTQSSIAVHRMNHSVEYIDIFSQSYTSFSTVMVGNTGYGKSVFLSQFIRCLYFDPKVARIIVIDVKGSNQRVVNALDGEIIDVNLNQSAGCNPFIILKKDPSEESLNLLKEFVSVLCLEENETFLSDRYGALIGIALKDYARHLQTEGQEGSFDNSNQKKTKNQKQTDKKESANPSLKEFIKYLPTDFDRINHIKRFTEGIEAKVFEDVQDSNRKSKLTYYYLKKLETAANKSLRRALVSVVLMEFYLFLRTKASDEKVVFICDEAPFFIKDAFPIFTSLIKNIRALNGSLVLAVQFSKDLLGEVGHQVDESLISQAAIKILFNMENGEQAPLFINRFGLSEEETGILQGAEKAEMGFSQFLIKDRLGSRFGRLHISDEEYWESVTGGFEIAEIEKLKNMYPYLNEREVVQILSRAKARQNLLEKRKNQKPINEPQKIIHSKRLNVKEELI